MFTSLSQDIKLSKNLCWFEEIQQGATVSSSSSSSSSSFVGVSTHYGF